MVLGDCELLLPVAKGGMGVVWAARRRGSGSPERVAVKTMLSSLAADARYEKMFLTEARLASRIDHRNVCRVLDHGERQGVLFLVMEWIEGEPLATLLSNQGVLPYPVAARLAMGAARGLHAAHEATGDDGAPLGLVHRDVSPRNLLVAASDGRVVVTDFGIAKATLRPGTSVSDGLVKGTVRYLAPEQVYSEEVDRRADVFALGAVLYEATTGVAPFAAKTDLGVLARIAGPEAARSPTFIDGYPAALSAVVERALRKDPSERFQTMDEFARALAEAAQSFGLASEDAVSELVRAKAGDRLRARKAAIERAAVEFKAPKVEGPVPPPATPRRRARGLGMLAVAIVLGAIVVARLARGPGARSVAEGTPAVTTLRGERSVEPSVTQPRVESMEVVPATVVPAKAVAGSPLPRRPHAAPAARARAAAPRLEPAPRVPDPLATRE
ncbi:MAG TPA: serine/threonine-protein kinase [Polyangiaceae bacterium]|nr:serine/threonine-protein kinase [Polyangiaceae bacterium]